MEWGRSDETDFVKKQVLYNVKSGEAKILDERDSGAQTSQTERMHYSVKSGEAKILGAVYMDSQLSEQKEKQITNLKSREEAPKRESDKKSNVTVEEMFQSQRTETTRTEFNAGENISKKVNRERLQPLQVIPAQKPLNTHHFVNSYTNLGYNHAYEDQNAPSSIQFQQPVAVVRAFVHPGSTRRIR